MPCWRREALALLAAATALGAQVFRAGASAVDLTPAKVPIVVSGGFLAATAERIAGPLYARALALDDGRERAVIAVVDTLMMPRELLDRVKAAASKSTAIPPERMLISATHTHSAPPVMGALGTDANPEYAQFLEERLVRVIEGAVSRLAPARVGWIVVQDWEHTHCRRWILRPDRLRKDPFGDLTVRAHMHPGYQNPEFIGPSGPVDPDLSVLAFQTPRGRPVALLANYSMHYVGAGARVVSPDYYGPFVENLQQRIGAQDGERPFIAMMSQGTSGDQHWMDYNRPRQEMTPQVYADAMARAAYEAYRRIEYRDWVPLRMREARLTLSRRAPGAERLAWARQLLAQRGGAAPRNQPEVYAREQLLLSAEPVRELKLQALRIGELGITAIPNEVFAITGLKIKAQSPLWPTFNIELANGAEGYIPPPEQHQLGGYTTWPARTAALEVQAEPRIVEALLGLLENVSGRRRRVPVDTPGPYAKAVLASRPVAFWRSAEFSGPVARDALGRRHATYEGGVAFYLDGPDLGGEELNRAPHFAGGRMRVSLKDLGDRYTVEFWFWNGLPADARPVTGYLLEAGGDQLAIGGTNRASGKLLYVQGDTVLEGTTPIPLKTWQHMALVRDRAKVAVYLNGVSEIQGAAEAAAMTGELFIAGNRSGAANFEGRIDEVALFARPLARSELAYHHRVGVSSGKTR